MIILRLYNGKENLFFFASYLRLTHSSPDTFQTKVPANLGEPTKYPGRCNTGMTAAPVPLSPMGG
jgi:hypothetical protein